MVPLLAHHAEQQLPIGSPLAPSVEPLSQSYHVPQVMVSLQVLLLVPHVVQMPQLAQSVVPHPPSLVAMQDMLSILLLVFHALLPPQVVIQKPQLAQLLVPPLSPSLHALDNTHHHQHPHQFAQHATLLLLQILQVALTQHQSKPLHAQQVISILVPLLLQFAQHAQLVAIHAVPQPHALHAMPDITLPQLLVQHAQQVLQRAQQLLTQHAPQLTG